LRYSGWRAVFAASGDADAAVSTLATLVSFNNIDREHRIPV
jgi:hypothetical protein